MNKRIMHISLCASFVLFAVTPKTFGHASTCQSPSNIVENMLEEIKGDPFFGSFWGYPAREPALDANSLNETLHKIRIAGFEAQQEATKSLTLLRKSNIKKTDLVNTIKDVQKHLGEISTQISSLAAEMDNNLAEVVERNNYKVKEYATEEYESDDLTKYGVKINLPGFTKNDIKVTISTDKKNNKIFNRLVINGTKKVTAATEEEKGTENKKITVRATSSQAFTSSSLINGRQKQIEYKDGTLKIKFDLPGDIDTQDGNYTMSFDQEKETLVLEFPRTSTSTKTQLKYTNTK